jgi:hypothetical protein
MAMLPIKDLGSVGVITDVAPYNLPLNAYSTGINVRFDEGKVSRSPIFRNIKDNIGYSPRFAYGIVPSNNFDSTLVVSDDWYLGEYSNGTVSNRSGSITGSTDPRPYTGTSLANVTYINRPDHVPVYRGPAGTNFADLPNWNSAWRCNSLRSFGDFLLGLNMSEGATSFPVRGRWSNITTANNVPDSWSEFDTTKSSGFNDLVQIKTEILDGAPLGSNFIIYSNDQVWLMEFVGGTFIFNFRQLFVDAGIMSQNCVVQIEGKHFCFGPFDIYVHDGTSKQSICDERTKDFIFGSLNNQAADVCFVHHNPTLNEVMFCYQSGDQYVAFPNADRCNRAAVYNYRNDTWSFMDLPNVSAGAVANVDSVATYATSTTTYALTGGTYYQQSDSFDKHSLMVGETLTADGLTSDKLYGLDLSDEGKIAFQLDTEATKPVLLERTGIDLDEAGLGANQYVVCTRIYPQADTVNTADTTLTFQFGASDIPKSTPAYSSSQVFDMATDHKIDSRAAGRYLSYKVSFTDNKDFELSKFDLEVTATGRR